MTEEERKEMAHVMEPVYQRAIDESVQYLLKKWKDENETENVVESEPVREVA